MLNIIPRVKTLEIKNGFLGKKAIFYNGITVDDRLLSALSHLPYDKTGIKVDICVTGDTGEEYELWIDEDAVNIKAAGSAGAFYAIQTLRQIFKHEQVPCLYIKDKPDFSYRGFYHDVTRGKVPTVATVKKLVDMMAYYKLNSLQLYVEHTFEFEECKQLNESMGYLTGEEIEEIDDYCKQNFVEFIPSLSTFGHLYELLEQDAYKHLRVRKDFKEVPNFWNSRMAHHTIDPLHPDSIEVIKSLIDQYAPHFESDVFNICCDETFDLQVYADKGYDVGKLYVDFVKQIVAHLGQKGKTVMMWADILLKHPETISELPEDIFFLNWDYNTEPSESNIARFAELHRQQIVCPGTSTWSRLCENVPVEEKNICRMAEYGYKYGAVGVLNTNWGDWGNPCCLELAMYGMVLGAEKSWSVSTQIDDVFYGAVNFLLYENENGIQYLKELSRLHEQIDWNAMCHNYFVYRFGNVNDYRAAVKGDIGEIQNAYKAFSEKLSSKSWSNDGYRQEMLLSAEGICLIAELSAKITGTPAQRFTDTRAWLRKYRQKWMEKNKKSELHRIEEMFVYCEEN